MNNMIQVFKYENADIRTTIINGEPWFCANDVCDYFGVQNRYRLLKKLDNDHKGYTHFPTNGGEQKLSIINESGLYELLFNLQPRKAKARGIHNDTIATRVDQVEKFQDWVCSEVLPSIRRTGGYVVQDIAAEIMNGNMEVLNNVLAASLQLNKKFKSKQNNIIAEVVQ